MAIYHDREIGARGGILTMGVFDGVHIGHRHLIAACRTWAQEIGTFSEVWIFHPHPRTILRGEKVPLLTTVEERIALLHEAGISVVRVITFSERLSQLPAERFILEWIQAVSAPLGLVLGYDHRFGQDRRGSAVLLRQMGFSVREVQAQEGPEGPISSSYIRRLLLGGQVHEAHQLLGYPFTIRGTVREGRQQARTFGVPTANIPYPPEKIRPAAGIYVGWAGVPHETLLPVRTGHPALLYLPPEGDLEVHLLNAAEVKLYDTPLSVGFLELLRPHQDFSSPEALIRQIHADVEAARSYFVREKK